MYRASSSLVMRRATSMKAVSTFITLSWALALTGCPSGTVTNPDTIVFPSSEVSFRNHVQPFLGTRCMPCHDNTNQAGGIRLTSYSTIMFDRPNLIVQGSPEQSLVVLALEQQIVHASGNFANIPSAQIQGVRTWVAEGAKNN